MFSWGKTRSIISKRYYSAELLEDDNYSLPSVICVREGGGGQFRGCRRGLLLLHLGTACSKTRTRVRPDLEEKKFLDSDVYLL
jgi:hypothetical protein